MIDLLPAMIPDGTIEDAGNRYRSECGANDLMMHRGRIITFEYYLSLHMAAEAVNHVYEQFLRREP